MSSTFFHDDKTIPPDEVVDGAAPVCEACQRPMWLIKVQTKVLAEGPESVREYECKICGTRRSLESKRDISDVVHHL